MPELPEVETIVRELQAVVPGARVRSVAVSLPKIVKLPVPRLRRAVLGSTIRHVHRRAKLVLIDLSSGWTLVIHLKMSGQLIWRPRRGRLRVGGHPIPQGTTGWPNKYSHVIIGASTGTLFFNDQRQFGHLKLVKTSELEQWLEEQEYGPEPLADDFTVELFLDLLRHHRRKRLKPTLMDQTVVAGVGNIYADEACHFARVRPQRRIASLTRRERRALYRGLRHVMALAIKHRGTSAYVYRRTDGGRGGMRPFLRVYGRGGQPCRRCGGAIIKTTLAGRGTHYCPNCQD
ncbi:MAG: bifunctional DNA-formamidopyrimidine glycosylase/DNA-(apurinic or apyrimidinic site) lyase [Candidatus Kerfeldbacteria bacterium]|nr:bifunctional DNA-formamidopyrimidine glycosylase/DNA-(apurinic or apyrimidinic site) lyase [Candidatus Kerfeldbacteria bacterium]